MKTRLLFFFFWLSYYTFGFNVVEHSIKKYRSENFFANPALLNLGFVDTNMLYTIYPKIINQNSEKLFIKDIKPTCPCTKILTKPSILNQNDSVFVEVEFNSWGFKNNEEIIKATWVLANDDKTDKKMKFYFKAIISFENAPIKLSKRVFESKNNQIIIDLTSIKELNNLSLTSTTDDFALISKPIITKGENSIILTTPPNIKTKKNTTITFSATDKELNEVVFSVAIIINP